jgi:hypothetical protein
MTVGERIVRVPHPRERTAGRSDHRKDEWAEAIVARQVARNFHAIALEGDFIVRLGDGLDARDGLGPGVEGRSEGEEGDRTSNTQRPTSNIQ